MHRKGDQMSDINHNGKDQPTADQISWVRVLELPLQEDIQRGWKPYFVFRGPTVCLPDLSCHVSVLSSGHTPHKPHQHAEEELLIILSGEAELIIPPADNNNAPGSHFAGRGSFVYYPAESRHTIRNLGTEPLTYLMFKWLSRELLQQKFQSVPVFFDLTREFDLSDQDVQAGFTPKMLFDCRTLFLNKLHGHISTLSPGAGYAPHDDLYDVAILVLSGTIETLGQKVGSNGIIFYAAGEPHGIKNIGDEAAIYLVFEFHGKPCKPLPISLKRRMIMLASQVKSFLTPKKEG